MEIPDFEVLVGGGGEDLASTQPKFCKEWASIAS